MALQPILSSLSDLVGGTPSEGYLPAYGPSGWAAVKPPRANVLAHGLATGSGAAAANATILQALIDAGRSFDLPEGTWYYDTPLEPVSGVAIRGVPGLSKLIYTGSTAGIQGRTTAAYRFTLSGVDLIFGGSGTTAHGIDTDRLRESFFDQVRVIGFPGNGINFDGSLAGGTGCWSNRLNFVEAKANNGHGFAFGENTNGLKTLGLLSQYNTLDGFWIGKKAIVEINGQSEYNGRHAVTVAGAFVADLRGLYAEHADPDGTGNEHASFAPSSPRHVLHLEPAADGTKSQVVTLGGFLDGRNEANALVYAEDDAFEQLVIDGGHWTAIPSNRASVYGTGNGRVIMLTPPNINGSAENATYIREHLVARYDLGAFGNRAVDFRGMVGRAEGFHNLLTNGGFDADLLTSTSVPTGWTQLSAATYSYEAGTDGGTRLILTNSGTNQSGIYQDASGPQIAGLVRDGRGLLAFDAITPTANSRDACQVRVRCHNGSGAAIAGGGLESWVIPASDSETHYAIPFAVPSGTTHIRVYVFASDGGASNTDVIKIDRMTLMAGELDKAYTPRPLTERGGRMLAGLQLPTKAGAFSDADFATAPANNSLIGLDTSNNRLYIKDAAGTYRYATLT